MCNPVPVIAVPCGVCNGEGIAGYRMLGVDYRDGSLRETWQDCPWCRGDGVELIEGEDVTEEERLES